MGVSNRCHDFEHNVCQWTIDSLRLTGYYNQTFLVHLDGLQHATSFAKELGDYFTYADI